MHAGMRLWYKKAAGDWNSALPLGNGFMGAMCFGGTLIDRFQLNNDSIWWGGPRDRINPDARESIPLIRALLREGRIAEAEELANETMAGIPENQSHYEPLGDLFLIPEGSERIQILGIREHWSGQLNRVEEIRDYQRILDIDQGVHTVSYTREGAAFRRESFISYPDRVLAIRCQGTPLRIFAERDNQCERVVKISDNTLCIEGRTGADGIRFCMVIRAVRGNPYIKGRTLHTDKESEILVASQTDFYVDDPVADALRTLDRAESLGFDALRERHTADVRELMSRCTLAIECEDRDDVPTDERLQAVQNGGTDHGLINLAFAYGRYLLVSSSRPGSLPANLQGIWNDSFSPAWDSKYTININAQMNYWPAEVTGLAGLHRPLFDLIRRMVPNGRRAASEMYGARGWMAHHNTDIYGDCAPQDTWQAASYWQMGAAWLCLHILEHARFCREEGFLEEYLPIVKEAALFFEDTLIENEQGQLVVSPSVSPENTYILPDGESGMMCEGASMDAQILYELFTGLIETGSISGEERERYTKILAKLPKPQISENGTIREWAKSCGEVEIGHRHMSHLFALYPGRQFFDSDDRDELLKAARATIERRLSHGGGHTGWSMAWIINLWARLCDGDKCYENIMALLGKSMLPNLFDNHPPFQIDGNFGLVSGIAEMLLQSHEGVDRLLPALPKAWPAGKVTGLRSRSGRTIDLEWRDGRIVSRTYREEARPDHVGPEGEIDAHSAP